MASVSTAPASLAFRFSAEFNSQIACYRRLIFRHRLTAVARQFRLEEDLVQLTLIDLARFSDRKGGLPAANDPHFRVILKSRVSNSFRHLRRQHREVVGNTHVSLDNNLGEDGEERGQRPLHDAAGPDVVLESAMRAQAIAALRVAIAQLAERQRQVIEMVLDDRTDAEIAAELGVTVQAVNKTRHTAIAKLRQLVPAGHAGA